MMADPREPPAFENVGIRQEKWDWKENVRMVEFVNLALKVSNVLPGVNVVVMSLCRYVSFKVSVDRRQQKSFFCRIFGAIVGESFGFLRQPNVRTLVQPTA